MAGPGPRLPDRRPRSFGGCPGHPFDPLLGHRVGPLDRGLRQRQGPGDEPVGVTGSAARPNQRRLEGQNAGIPIDPMRIIQQLGELGGLEMVGEG